MPTATALGGSDEALAASPDALEEFEEPEVTRLRALAWVDAISRHLTQRASERQRIWNDSVMTAAREHEQLFGHKLALGCCKERPRG